MSWTKAREAILNCSESSSIYIGCDSLVRGKSKSGTKIIDYSVVIIVHKDSRHGCQIFHKHYRELDYSSSAKKGMRQRLMSEVQYALAAYSEIEDTIGGRHVEVHLDVNSDAKHASNTVTNEALGWVRGMGIEARIKPDGFAATHAADHCVRRKSAFKNG